MVDEEDSLPMELIDFFPLSNTSLIIFQSTSATCQAVIFFSTLLLFIF